MHKIYLIRNKECADGIFGRIYDASGNTIVHCGESPANKLPHGVFTGQYVELDGVWTYEFAIPEFPGAARIQAAAFVGDCGAGKKNTLTGALGVGLSVEALGGQKALIDPKAALDKLCVFLDGEDVRMEVITGELFSPEDVVAEGLPEPASCADLYDPSEYMTGEPVE